MCDFVLNLDFPVLETGTESEEEKELVEEEDDWICELPLLPLLWQSRCVYFRCVNYPCKSRELSHQQEKNTQRDQ